eukprot:Sspe_Gene.70919::Locus_41916_Transcript_1_1_Confidence_1.000_Length_626::g.70919::m.70919
MARDPRLRHQRGSTLHPMLHEDVSGGEVTEWCSLRRDSSYFPLDPRGQRLPPPLSSNPLRERQRSALEGFYRTLPPNVATPIDPSSLNRIPAPEDLKPGFGTAGLSISPRVLLTAAPRAEPPPEEPTPASSDPVEDYRKRMAKRIRQSGPGLCHYIMTAEGCRRGMLCPFSHDISAFLA